MLEERCEMRFDVSLPNGGGTREFERSWRETLAAQKMTALAMPPARAVSARFRLYGAALSNEQTSVWERSLTARLGALPGSPMVSADPPCLSADWQGVRIWLAFPTRDLAALLHTAKLSQHPARKFSPARGNRR